MTLPPFVLPETGKHSPVLYGLAASTMSREALLGYFGACLRSYEIVLEEHARPLMELAGVVHGDRNRFVRDLVAEAGRQRKLAAERAREHLRFARRASNSMLKRRLRAYDALFPKEETRRHFAKLLDVKVTKDVDIYVEGFDCRLRPVHTALVIVTVISSPPFQEKRRGFFLYRVSKGRLGSVQIVYEGPPGPPTDQPKTPAIPGLIRALEVDSVVAAREQGCSVSVLWDRQQHHVRHPDGREMVVAWRPRLVF